ncbi:sulfur carrier protein ThiS [Zobellella maritima]|uniref:sulfur carrier protein ThiS n=1 Tax=Zobellella maritima TaxID=2059725 RepID=UPI000E30968D
MQVTVNEEFLQLTPGTSLQGMLVQLQQDKPGVAVALNQQVVARSQWSQITLNGGDQITLFHAIAGG